MSSSFEDLIELPEDTSIVPVLDWNKMIIILKAMQTEQSVQNTRIEALEARVTTLEGA